MVWVGVCTVEKPFARESRVTYDGQKSRFSHKKVCLGALTKRAEGFVQGWSSTHFTAVKTRELLKLSVSVACRKYRFGRGCVCYVTCAREAIAAMRPYSQMTRA